jgi:hypothetical protein
MIVDSACKCCAAVYSHHQFQLDNHFMLYSTGIGVQSAVLSLLPPESFVIELLPQLILNCQLSIQTVDRCFLI